MAKKRKPLNVLNRMQSQCSSYRSARVTAYWGFHDRVSLTRFAFSLGLVREFQMDAPLR